MREAGRVRFADVSFNLPQTPSQEPGEGRRTILHHISLDLQAGSWTALLGRSGSGKTTLLRMVNGLILPNSGEVWVDGAGVTARSAEALRRRIGYVIQETGLFPHMSIERNVAMPLELAGVPAAEQRERAHAMLNRVALPAAEFAGRLPWQLSGGQRQRAGLARALVAEPSLLLMDEPFGALDPLTRAEMQAMLHDLLREQPITVVLVTHDLDEALYLADRVVFLQEGRVMADLSSKEVPHAQNATVAEYVRAVRRFEVAP